MKKALIQISLTTLFILLTACAAFKTPSPLSVADNQPVDKITNKQANKEANKPQFDIKKCTCIQLWMPVCGENARTYSNACFAKCANVKFKQGPCTKDISD